MTQLFKRPYIIIAMRIKDTSTVYSYSISVCMGSFVFGYELTSFGNLNQLVQRYNQWESQAEAEQTLMLLSTLLALAAIFGKDWVMKEWRLIDSSYAPSDGYKPSKLRIISPSSQQSSECSVYQ